MAIEEDAVDDCSPDEFRIRKMVASNIRKYREERHLTQEMLAEKMDMTSVTVSRLENMLQWPSPHTLLSLTKALDVRPYQIFLEDGAEDILPANLVMKAFERSIKTFNSEIDPIIKSRDILYSIEHKKDLP
ncbi:MAG: helix-turn-helix domain-containing protein [Treponema sp.]|nr:helix-turn-helix domain-containing protein [Treponema sp.]